MTIKCVVLSTALLISMNVSAQMYKWTPIAENDNGPAVGIDYTRSFVANRMPVIFWNDYSMSHLQSVERPGNRPMTIYRTKIDCANRMLSNQYHLLVEVKHFYDSNPQQFRQAWSGSGTWYVPDVNSAAEFVMNFFCDIK